MPSTSYTFPFGQPVEDVVQIDRTPKRVFVLGVYASAVHAQWLDKDGKVLVKALAVASEPYIFWRGEGVEAILNRINIPPEIGSLEPADPMFNGPSGIALDEAFLHPLGLQREDAWLCDLVPHSCLNPSQAKAIKRAYEPLMPSYTLPQVTVPPVPRQLADIQRQQAIAAELAASGAKTIILLGDEPLHWFLRAFDSRWRKLSDFGQSPTTYGQLHTTQISGQAYSVLPLVHPRQANKLGKHSAVWSDLHQHWIKQVAGTLKI